MKPFGKNNRNENECRINEQIRGYYEARVIYKEKRDETSPNDFNKVMSVNDAMRLADSLDLDLVEINRNAPTPILQICDYSKYKYEKKRQQKKNKATIAETKEIQLSVNISEHDLQTKLNKAIEFLGKGDNVKVVLVMRGREMSRREESKRSFYEFLSRIEEYGRYGSQPKDEGNRCMILINPKKK